VKTLTRTTTYPSPADIVFQCLDNLGVTGTHMTQSSAMMMGSKLDLRFLTEHHTGLGTKYRWTGKMMGLKMDFTVEVTKWMPGEEKIWETIGEPELIIYSWYRMHLMLTETMGGTCARLSISYKKPKGIFHNLLSFLFADWYCKWCLKHMLEDANKLLMNDKEHGEERKNQ